MSARRLGIIVLSVAGALLLAIVLYAAFGGLGRHKNRIEALVTERIGRPFAIEGAFEAELLPSIRLLAERVRVGNVQWGSQPQMIEVGRFSTNIGLWSLVAGPVDIRSLELIDVSIVLERGPDGQGNWVLAHPGVTGKDSAPAAEVAEVPAVILHAELRNVRVVYLERDKPERVALLEEFTIAPGSDGLFAIAGKGRLDDYPATLKGELGPLEGLLAGRDIRMALHGAIGNLRLDASGGLGRLNPLDGAELALKVENPDIGAMLKKLRLPAVATGALRVDARLKDAGELTRLDLSAELGDITAKADGTLRALGLPGSDLRFEVSVANAARLAAALDMQGLPAGPLRVGGRVASSRTEITLDGINATFADARAKADGTIRMAAEPSAAIRLELAAGDLARLHDGLPKVPLSLSATYAGSRDRFEVKDLKCRIGESDISGRASIVRRNRTRVEADLASPRLDLASFAAGEAGSEAKKTPKKKFVFGEEPLPLEHLKGVDVKVRLAAAEVRFGEGTLRDIEGTLTVDGGRLSLETRARGGIEGELGGSLGLVAVRDGGAELTLRLAAKGLRTGVEAGAGLDPGQVPASSLDAVLAARGKSARQMASSANGHVLVTQGPGRMKGGVIGLLGGDTLGELAGRLNPFAAKDPYTQLECTVARVDIIDGQATVRPVLLQSQKVAIVAGGAVNLRTEELTISFNTRPRTGVGISPGMFTNPFIEVAGTLASPRISISAKGTVAAAATGGASVLAQGLWDRIVGGTDQCKNALEAAAAPAKK